MNKKLLSLNDTLVSDFNFMDSMMSDFYRKVNKQKEDFIKQKFIDKGFGNLFDGIEKKVFPKIAIITAAGWDYYYADDNTDAGFFIVAIKDIQNTTINGENKITFSFNWQDSKPLIL